tara:strand:- start:41 stop:355 length:315 start_codon:yes stop_codon:yes gene_type:complete
MLEWFKKQFGSFGVKGKIADCVRLADELAHSDEINEAMTGKFESVEEDLRKLSEIVDRNNKKEIIAMLANINGKLKGIRLRNNANLLTLKTEFAALDRELRMKK